MVGRRKQARVSGTGARGCLDMSLLFARILIRRARVERAYSRGNVFTHAVTIAFRHSCILIVGLADIAVTLLQEQGSTLG